MARKQTVIQDIKAWDEELVPLICIKKGKCKVRRRHIPAICNTLYYENFVVVIEVGMKGREYVGGDF